MAGVSVLEFQKDRAREYERVGSVVKCGRGILDNIEQECAVISRRCHSPRRTPVAMRGALAFAARIMSCEKLPNLPIRIQIRRSGPQYLASGPSLYCPAYQSCCKTRDSSAHASRCRGCSGRTAVRLRTSNDVIWSSARPRCYFGRRCAWLGGCFGIREIGCLVQVRRCRPRMLSCELDSSSSTKQRVSNCRRRAEGGRGTISLRNEVASCGYLKSYMYRVYFADLFGPCP